MSEPQTIYVLQRTVRMRQKNGASVTLKPNTVLRRGGPFSDEQIDDCLQQGWITEQLVAAQGRAPQPDKEQEPEEPKGTVRRTNEGLDADALASLETDTLLAYVAERAGEDSDTVVEYLRGADDVKKSAIDFLSADIDERVEFLRLVSEFAAEQAAAKDEADAES